MDGLEVAVSGPGCDGSVVLKGKRMKRQRPPSPLWSSGSGCATSSSSSAAGDFSPPSSSGKLYESTEEDEDLAHCLILLAQGPRRLRLCHEGSEARGESRRRSSKKFSEVVVRPVDSGASGAVAKAGFYVYECKTCSRVFPSFQALGGHRASHKKPKTTAAATEDVMKKLSPATPDIIHEYEDDHDEGQFRKFSAVSPLCSSSQLPVVLNKPKIHECSICGSEFSSGQALGGHMRRHRATMGTAGAKVTVLGLESVVVSNNSSFHVEEKSRDVLSLDLNLPAPPEEEHQIRDLKLQLVAARPIVLSSPALVGCHN